MKNMKSTDIVYTMDTLSYANGYNADILLNTGIDCGEGILVLAKCKLGDRVKYYAERMPFGDGLEHMLSGDFFSPCIYETAEEMLKKFSEYKEMAKDLFKTASPLEILAEISEKRNWYDKKIERCKAANYKTLLKKGKISHEKASEILILLDFKKIKNEVWQYSNSGITD